VFDRLLNKNVAVNPRKIELGLAEVEYVCHLVSATGTSFTPNSKGSAPIHRARQLLPRSCA
jgi:hypothetical protein